MWLDSTGEPHFEFWEGIKISGKTFQSVPLFNVCRTYGDAAVIQACENLGCRPYIADLEAIKDECERIESSYV